MQITYSKPFDWFPIDLAAKGTLNYIPASHAAERATVLSFGSLVKGLFVVMLAIPTGGIGGAKSLVGWVLPAGLLLIVALIGNFVLRREERLTPEAASSLDGAAGA